MGMREPNTYFMFSTFLPRRVSVALRLVAARPERYRAVTVTVIQQSRHHLSERWRLIATLQDYQPSHVAG